MRGELGESIEIAALGDFRRPRHEIVSLDRAREFWRSAEETPRLVRGKSGKPRRLQISGGTVGRLDQRAEFRRKLARQTEAQMDGDEEARLYRLVGIADHGLERRDHVADHVFRGIVEENAEAARTVEARALARDRFDQERMLGDGEDVRAFGLPIPAGNPRETVRNVGDLDVERGRVEQVEPAPRQHALPGARLFSRARWLRCGGWRRSGPRTGCL